MGCQTSRNVCGIILLFLHKCGLRGGVVFQGPLPEGWALVGQVGRLLCLRDGKEGGKMEKEGGLNEGKAFSKPFYPFILWLLHAHIHIQAQRAQQTKSGCDIIHRKKCQTTLFFSLFAVLCALLSEVRSLPVCQWLAEKERIQRSSRGARELDLSSTGSFKSRGEVPESSLNFPQRSTTFQTCCCRISARYSADCVFSIL